VAVLGQVDGALEDRRSAGSIWRIWLRSSSSIVMPRARRRARSAASPRNACSVE